jgi:hypothetical protein
MVYAPAVRPIFGSWATPHSTDWPLPCWLWLPFNALAFDQSADPSAATRQLTRRGYPTAGGGLSRSARRYAPEISTTARASMATSPAPAARCRSKTLQPLASRGMAA